MDDNRGEVSVTKRPGRVKSPSEEDGEVDGIFRLLSLYGEEGEERFEQEQGDESAGAACTGTDDEHSSNGGELTL